MLMLRCDEFYLLDIFVHLFPKGRVNILPTVMFREERPKIDLREEENTTHLHENHRVRVEVYS